MVSENISNEEYIYVFVHIPKCAGVTFKTHIYNNFKSYEILELYPNDLIKSREDAELYVKNLPEVFKKDIKIILGHRVFFGIEKYFNKKIRYITFLRNPYERTISHYNFCRTGYEKNLNYFPSIIDENGDIIEFEDWFLANPSLSDFIIRFLIFEFFGNSVNEEINGSDLKLARDLLDKFFFVGLTENYDSDASVLYPILGMKNSSSRENISKKFLDNNRPIRNVFLKNKNDMKLYDYAKLLNERFKKSLN